MIGLGSDKNGDKPIKVDVSAIHNDVQLVSPLGVRLAHLYLLTVMMMVMTLLSLLMAMMTIMLTVMTKKIIVCTSTVAEVLSFAATAESIVAFTGPYGLSFTFKS